MPPPRYPSDLSDEEWALLKPLLSRAKRRGRPSRWPTRRIANALCSTCLGAAARGGCCPGSSRLGRPSTTTSAGGEPTDGSGERTTACARRCAR